MFPMIDNHGTSAAERGPTGMSSSQTSQRRSHLDNLTDALGGALCTWTMPSRSNCKLDSCISPVVLSDPEDGDS